MLLRQLIQDLPIRPLAGSVDTEVSDLTDDSRRASPGCLFVARKGSADDGARYVDEALARGAAAVVGCDHAALVELARRFFGDPSKPLRLIGVTGTNGKTTTAYLVRHLLNARGGKCGMMTTVAVDVGDGQPQAASLTTPGVAEVNRMLRRMVDGGCAACVMECSSHALEQGRCDGLDFDTAVFTNLSGDHLDYHGTMDDYAAAKARLFARAKVGWVNADDPASATMAASAAGRVLRFGMGAGYDLGADIVSLDATGCDVRLIAGPQQVAVRLPLIGCYNAQNLLAACGGASGDAVDLDALAPAVTTMTGAPGRLERVSDAPAPFAVLVDYAHTDDAMRNVLEALRPLATGRLRVLFGCGGDRDATKRPRMGRVASKLADDLVITSDNPRTEDPGKIIDAILQGVDRAACGSVEVIADRTAAIRRIIEQACAGDIVLLAGKGHEMDQIVGDQRRPFDDRIEARRALGERLKASP